MEFDDKLIEASSLSPAEKMRLFNTGMRDSNVKAMSDDKLLNNQKICIDNGYWVALSKIETEMIYRGLIKTNSIEYLKYRDPQVEDMIKAIDLKNVFAEQFKYIRSHILEPEVILKDAEDGFGTKYATATNKAVLKVFGLLYCLVLQAPDSTINELKKILTDPFGNMTIGSHVFTSPQNMAILKHLITLMNFNTGIISKITDFVNNKFTESYDIKVEPTDNLEEDIEKHNELNPKLWDNNTLRPEVAEKINQIVDEFLDSLNKDGIKFKLDDVWLTGSNASFNWTKNSDLDIHLLFDLSIYTDEEKQEMADLIYSYYTKDWKNKLTITIYGIPVELYIETNYEK